MSRPNNQHRQTGNRHQKRKQIAVARKAPKPE